MYTTKQIIAEIESFNNACFLRRKFQRGRITNAVIAIDFYFDSTTFARDGIDNHFGRCSQETSDISTYFMRFEYDSETKKLK